MANLRIKTSEVVSDGLVWVAFIAGIAGAFALSGSQLGEKIGEMVGALPWWLVLGLAFVGLARVIFDIKDDGVPNRLSTMYITVLWPSWLLGVEGNLAGWVTGWIHNFNEWLYDKAGPLVNDDPKHTNVKTLMAGLAAVLVGFALYTAHRYFASKRANRTATATTAAANNTAPITINPGSNRKKR